MKKEILKGIVLMMVGAMSLGGMKVDGVKIPANERNTASVATDLLGAEGEIPADELRMYEQRAVELAAEMEDAATERSEVFHRTGIDEEPDEIRDERIEREVLESNPAVYQRLRRLEELRNMSETERNRELLNLRPAMNMVQSNLQVRTMGRNLLKLLNRQVLRSVDIFVQIVSTRVNIGIITPADMCIAMSRRLYREVTEAVNTEKDRLSNSLNGRLSGELLDNISEIYLGELVDRLSLKLLRVLGQA